MSEHKRERARVHMSVFTRPRAPTSLLMRVSRRDREDMSVCKCKHDEACASVLTCV